MTWVGVCNEREIDALKEFSLVVLCCRDRPDVCEYDEHVAC